MAPEGSISPVRGGSGNGSTKPGNPVSGKTNGSTRSKEAFRGSGTSELGRSEADQSQGVSERSQDEEADKAAEERAQEAAELLNKTADIFNRELRFNVVPSENLVQAEIVDRESDEVIQQIPPDDLIKLRKRIDAFLGLFIDETR